MNLSPKLLTALLAVTLALPFLGASERSETLRAINWVENPTNHTRRGSRGELGPYQFMPQTWKLHTRVPFNLAIVREHADAVAVKHYEWIKSGLRSAGIDANPFNIALAWNCGLGAVTAGRVPTVSYAYAERVQNLVEQQRSLARAATQNDAVAKLTSPKSRTDVAQSDAIFAFSPASASTRFVIETSEPLYQPVVRTEKTSVASADAADIPVVVIAQQTVSARASGTGGEKSVLSDAATPRFALIR